MILQSCKVMNSAKGENVLLLLLKLINMILIRVME